MLAKRIEQVLKTLTYREREIIKLRYGIGDGYTYTLEEVGRIFKVTRERVRQVEAKAIRKLQHPVRARKLQGFVSHRPRIDTGRHHMKTNQTTSAFSRMTRISAAGILIAFSGTAVALADDAPARGSADGDAPTRVIRASATRARAASPAKAELTDAALTKGEAEKPAVVVEPTLPEGEALESFYASVPLLLRRMHPNLRAMSDADILRLVQKRAAEINAEKMGVDLPDTPQAGSGPGGRVFSMNDTDSRAGDRTRLDPGPGNWWNNPNTPKMGEGYRADYSPVYREEHEMNLQRLRLRSMFGGYADYSNLAFADIIADIDQGGRWPTLALPSNTQDFDGDGELFDPLPARPIVVYYQSSKPT
jgi:hypothetical protein